MNEISQRPRVVVLTPVYNEESNLPHYEARIREVLFSSEKVDFEVLFIDDGSSDHSWELIREIAARDSRFSGVRLSRNFGSHVALSAGLDCTNADAMATLACDLQDPPEVVLEFVEKWRGGAQIVWGHRRTRDESTWRVIASRVLFGLLKKFAMPRDSKFATGSFLLADRKVVDCIKQYRERNRIMFALVAWTGFDQAIVEYDRQRRTHGKSRWSFGMMIKTMYDAFIGYSYVPTRLLTMLGLGFFTLAILLVVYLVGVRFLGNPQPGWTSIMISIAVFFGIQFLLVGYIGEYLHRIYLEVAHRPLYFVSDQTTGHSESNGKSLQPVAQNRETNGSRRG